MQAIYLDMDGTIADLYGVDCWLEKLRSSDVSPYQEAKPLINVRELETILKRAQALGVTVGVISWLAKGSSLQYAKQVKAAKVEWLRKHFRIEFDEVHILNYGRPKQHAAHVKDSILIDDSPIVCGQWGKHNTIDAKQNNWLEALSLLLDRME